MISQMLDKGYVQPAAKGKKTLLGEPKASPEGLLLTLAR